MNHEELEAIREIGAGLRVVATVLERLVVTVELAADRVVEASGEVRAAVEHQIELDHGGRR